MANPSLVPDLVRHRLIIDHRDIVVLFLCLYSELFGKIPGHYYVALLSATLSIMGAVKNSGVFFRGEEDLLR